MNLTDHLALSDVSLADVAHLTGGTLVGEDIAIRHLRPLSAEALPEGSLTYATEHFLSQLDSKPFAAAIVPVADTDSGRPAVVHTDPARAFFYLHRQLAEGSAYPTLEGRIGENVRISDTAVVHSSVILGDGVHLGDNVVVMPNTILGDGSQVQAGTVIGEPGFQVADDLDGRYLVPHIGGVSIGRGVSIGANCAIDRALFSTATAIGNETMLDNLVHVAHDVAIGARCTLTASVELSGSVTLDDDVWLAPRTCCNQFIRFGRGAYTGTGSVVVRDVPAHTLVMGSPARPAGTVCICRSKLAESSGSIECRSCGRHFLVQSDGIVFTGRIAA